MDIYIDAIKIPEEGRKLIKEIQTKVEQLELNQKELELKKKFEDANIYGSLPQNIDSGYICYIAIYINNCIGGIVKVKLNKKEYDTHLYKFYFVGVDNDLNPEDFKQWKVVNRPNHPYNIHYNMMGPTLVEPIIYSNNDNRRQVKFLQLK